MTEERGFHAPRSALAWYGFCISPPGVFPRNHMQIDPGIRPAPLGEFESTISHFQKSLKNIMAYPTFTREVTYPTFTREVTSTNDFGHVVQGERGCHAPRSWLTPTHTTLAFPFKVMASPIVMLWRSQLLGVPSYWAFPWPGGGARPWPSGAGGEESGAGPPFRAPVQVRATFLAPHGLAPLPGHGISENAH